MKATNLAYTCYPVTNLKVARKFYEEVLGLKPTSTWVKDDTNGFVEYDIGTTTLAIGAGAENFKVGEGGGVVAIEVSDFDDTIKELKAKKCKFILETEETPVCFMALLADPDGNKLMIHHKKGQV